MPNGQLTVVISAGQSRNPEKRELEQNIAQRAGAVEGVRVVCVAHLYDLAKDGETYQMLRHLDGDMLLISWMFPRAAHWILDRNGVRGQVGTVELQQEFDEDDEEQSEPLAELEEERVASLQPRPQRTIYTLDFRASEQALDFVAEIERIVRLPSDKQVPGEFAQPLTLEMLTRFENPTNDTYVGSVAPLGPDSPVVDNVSATSTLFGSSSVATIQEHPGRRWYPVIDFSRCTNCMECIDFCLFGVYGIDSQETILVEQADNCRKGCPACSRVCPQNAIMFPQHKTPAIAGAPVDAGGLKIDLSKLFGAPDEGEDAAAAAIRERDEQLVLAGRQAVGDDAGLSERIGNSLTNGQPADQLDDLIDQLDALDL